MRLRRIDHIGIVVADLAVHVGRLEALGLSLGRVSDSDQSHAEYFPCGDASVELIEVRDASGQEQRLPAGQQARIEHIAFEVDSSLEQVRCELEALGVEVSWPPWASGEAEMIRTTAETSGGVQYQFMRRADEARAGQV